MISIQLVLYCLLFTGMVRYAVRGGAIDGLYFYPKAVQERAFLTIVWTLGAAIVAGIIVLIFGLAGIYK